MSNPTDPPRSGLTQKARDFIAACSWSSSGLVDGSGKVVKAALTQSGSPGTSVVVAWNPTTLAEHGDAVTVTIPEETYETICKGTFDATTGKVTYEKKTYGFQHVVSNGVPTMRRCEC